MEYLHNDHERFLDTITFAFDETGIIPSAIEKDYYVTLLLRLLSQTLPNIVFKGGTSLSKCHHVIHRFSEDIDLTTNIPLTQGQKKLWKQEILRIAENMGLTVSNKDDIRSRRDFNKYLIEYKSILPKANVSLQPVIIIETSFTAVSFPTVTLPVTSTIGDMMEKEAPEYLKIYQLDPFTMPVQDLRRTLADKVFAICDYYLQNNTTKYSRHIYDIYKLIEHINMDTEFRTLVEEIRNVRKTAPICPSAQDDVDVTALLYEIIAKEVYKSDYTLLTEQLLEEKVSYETAIMAVRKIADLKIFDKMV